MSATQERRERVKQFLAGLLRRCRKCWISRRNGFDGYCLDCWPGYDNCRDPECSHYRCEHVFPDTIFEVAYSRDEPETVGTQFEPEVGCMNADCPCKGFIEAKP